MFELLIVILLLVIVVQLFTLKQAIAGVANITAALATNPIRHQVTVESDLSEKLGDINSKLFDLSIDVNAIRGHFVSDEVDSYDWPT